MVFKFNDFWDCVVSGIQYVPDTMYAVCVSLVICLILGTVMAVLINADICILSKAVSGLFTILRGVPPTLLFIVIRLLYSTVFAQYIAAHDFGITLRDINIIYVGIVSLSIFLLPIITEAIRGALLSIPRNQYEAAYSVGLTGIQTYRRVIIPQILPIAMPVLINNFIILLKSSSLLFLIGVMDIYNGSLKPANITYGFFEGYVAAGVIYFVIFFAAERFGAFLEKRFAVNKHGTVRGAGV